MGWLVHADCRNASQGVRFMNLITRYRSVLPLFALTLSACSGDDASPATRAELLAAPAPGSGVQYRMVSTLEPGTEVERCQLVVAPPEGLRVHHEEVRFTRGSHHVLLYRTPYQQIPTADRNGVALDATQVHDCSDGPIARWEVNGVIAGSQSSDGDSIVGKLPDGVALTVEPGTVLLMNTHYLNAGQEPLATDARINLHSLPEGAEAVEAGVLFYYNPFIHVPARERASARMRCHVPHDISVLALQSHMHRRGVDFAAHLTDETGAALQEIYTNTEWEGVPVQGFAPALHVKAGQGLDYRCTYQNSEDRVVAQGLTTRDEMCMLIGPYYPRNAALEACRDDAGQLSGTWIGEGTATCGATLGCLVGATSQAAVYGCVVKSCPGASEEVSAFMRCQLSARAAACKSECAPPGANCAACLTSACAPSISACQTATCE
jgi:hypothetical protein